MKLRRVCFVILILVVVSSTSTALQHNDSTKNLSFELTQGALVSSGNTAPFWLVANNSQRISSATSSTWTRFIHKKKLQKDKTWNWGYLIDLVGRYDGNWSADLTQAYIQSTNKLISVSVGRREEYLGIVDSTLSIGSLINGNNALPVPKIVIQTNGWLNIPWTKGILQFNTYYSHGWLEKDRFTRNALLHQKYFYLQVGKTNWPIKVYSGILWNTQWSGTNPVSGKQPSSFSDYIRIVTGSNGGLGATQSDQNNALGNHLGIWDIGLKAELREWRIGYYFQFLWEDKSGLTPFNWRDGMMGISLKRKEKKTWISGLNLEIIRTNDQDSEKVGSDGMTFLEPDNFFNNSGYPSGWSYKDVVIGNPVFILTNRENSKLNDIANLINGVNFGIEGSLKKISYRLKYIYFQNQGQHTQRFKTPFRNHSILISGLFNIKKKALVSATMSKDFNNLSENSFGILIEYSRKIF